MPLMRYFLFVGTALMALLFIVDAYLPKLAVVESANRPVNIASDLSVIRIHSDRKWPERVEFDTSLATITPAPVRTAAASIPTTAADVTAPTRMRDAFAQLQTTQLQPPELKKLEPKLSSKRKLVANRTVASRTVAKSHPGSPVILVAQQPRLGFFANTMW